MKFILRLALFTIIISMIVLLIDQKNTIINLKQANYAQIEVVSDPGTPYNIKILNDHDILLTTADDTIKLSLENAYSLQDEYVVFVGKK